MSFIRRTPYFHKHQALGAEFVDRFGFAAAYRFRGTPDEHRATREGVGVFDVYSQVMIDLQGRDALPFLASLLVGDLGRLSDGQVLYTSLCNEAGGMVDDLTVFRLGHDHVRLSPTPSRVAAVTEWLVRHRGNCAVSIVNLGNRLAYLSVQGPNSRALLQRLTEADLSAAALPYFRFLHATVAEVPGTLLSRTGYSGELGFELFFPSEYAEHLWDRVFEAGSDLGATACGLGALVSLRLEKRYPLYGLDLTEATTPIEAGLGWTVRKNDDSFVGASMLRRQLAEGPARRLVQLVMPGDGPPIAPGAPVVKDGAEIGRVTSAGLGHSVGRWIALAYVETRRAEEGAVLTVAPPDGPTVPAELRSKPLWDPERQRLLS
jgi:aminomethyltransferase